MIFSDSPAEYTSAVSTNVPPASTKRSSWACATCSSDSRPKVMVPRQSAETAQPLRPRVRYSMTANLCPRKVAGDPGGGSRPAPITGTPSPLPDVRRANHIDEQCCYQFLQYGRSVPAEHRLGVEL